MHSTGHDGSSGILSENPDISTIDLVLYDSARDIAQGFGVFPHSNRDSGVCFCAPDFYSQILSVGTVLSAASSGCRKESLVCSCRNGTQYPVGGSDVAHSRSCHRSQWPHPASLSANPI
jgi:hypothetical protein